MSGAARMSVGCLLFAVARERVGVERVDLSLPAGARVTDALAELARAHPVLDDVAARCRVAVNAEFSGLDQVLADGDEIALIPPVSGG